MRPDEFAARMQVALDNYDRERPRSRQRMLGFSDLACHEKARRKLIGAVPTDAPTRWTALTGTAVHAIVAAAVSPVGEDGEARFTPFGPHIVIEPEMTVKLDNGLKVTGHPDLILRLEPSCNDCKSVNGPGELARKRRHGPEEAEIMQVSLGYHAAVQNGLIDTYEGIVRIFWVDRSGATSKIEVWQERFDPAWVDRAAQWYDDAAYAAEHNEEALKDRHWSWCRRYCEFFTDCRGGNVAFGPVIEDERLIKAAVDYHQAKARRNEAAAEMKAARAVLEELKPESPSGDMVTCQVGPQRVRWTWINRSDLEKGGYYRLDDDEIENGVTA